MTSKTPKHTPNNSQTQVKKTGGVDLALNNTRKQFLDTLENIKLREILGEDYVSFRVTLLRHYPYIEDNEGNYKKYNALLDKILKLIPLNEAEQNQLKELEEKIKVYENFDDIPGKKLKETIEKVINNSKKLLLFYDDSGEKIRVKITGEDLVKRFGIKNTRNINLKGSDKGMPTGETYIKMANEIKEELLKIIEDKSIKNVFDNIVIVSNRTYSHGFNIIEGKRKVTIEESEKTFEENGYFYNDYNNEGKIIPKKSHYIGVNPENYLELKEIFPDISHNSIIDFQNKLNVYFIQKPEEFEKFLLCDNQTVRIFCITNLIKNDKFETIEKNINKVLEKTKEENIIYFIQTILDIGDDEQKKLLSRIIIERSNILSNIKVDKLEYYMNYEKYVKNNIDYLREKTQDENIKKGKSVSISIGFKEEKYNLMDNMLNGDNILLIEASAGSGKSIKLLEIMEYLFPKENINENKYFPIYVHLGKYKNIDEINNELERQKTGIYGTGKYQYVYLFDAIDESGMNENSKNKFLEKIKELQKTGKVIITSRYGHLADMSIEKVELKPLTPEQIEEYIKTYISGNEEWERVWQKWQRVWQKWQREGFIDEIKDNPLMLSMLVELIKNTNKIKKLKEFGLIENLNVEKKSDLFDIIVTLRLYEGEIKKINEGEGIIEMDNIKNIINKRKKILELIALKSIEKYKFLSKDEIESLIMKEGLGGGMIGRKELLENLNLIFKYNQEKQQYQFVHEKFREYFMYVNFMKKVGNKEIHTKEIWDEYIGKVGYITNIEHDILLLKKLSCISFDNEKIFQENLVKYITILINNKNEFYIYGLLFVHLKEKGLPILEKIIELPGFKNNKDVLKHTCKALWYIQSEKGLPILEKIIELPGFKNNKDAIMGACGAIQSEKGLPILEKIIELPGFKNNKDAIMRACGAIEEIQSEKGLPILEKIIELPGFKNTIVLPGYEIYDNAISFACGAIYNIKSEKGLPILEKIIELPGLKNNKYAVKYICRIILLMESNKGLIFLEKLIETLGLNNYFDITKYICGAIEEFGNKEGVQISEELQQFRDKYGQQ